MGRLRKSQKHLPRGMLHKHGAFYVKSRNVWTRLAADYGEALRKYAELVGVAAKPVSTIAEGIAVLLAVRARDLKPDTIAGYEQSAKRLIPVFGAMAPEELRRDHVYRYLIERGDVAANRDRALLSAMYCHLQNAGLFRGQNPCLQLRYRNPERPRLRYVTDAELALLVTRLPRVLSLMARWSYATGMRESDVLALRLTAASDAGVLYTPSKRRKTTHAPPALILWSEEVRAIWREAAGLRIGAQPLFPAHHGGHFTRNGFQSTWQRWRKRIGIPDLRWHDIRRKTGSDSATDEAARAVLSQADVATTRKHYRAKPREITPIR